MNGICTVKIITEIGGETSVFRGTGEAETTLTSATVRCKQGDGRFCLRLEKGKVFVERDGDYILRLELAERERTIGAIGLSGAEGEIEIFTQRLRYALRENSLLLSVKYALYFGAEKQETSLTFSARQ